MITLNKAQIKKYVRIFAPVYKRHYFIVTLALFGGVAFATYTVNSTLSQPPDTEYHSEQLQQTIGNKFNASTKETITILRSLNRSSEPAATQPLPPGRINPFTEQ